MTTTLIPPKSSAPTLRELAIGSWQQLVEAREAEEQANRTAEFKRKVDVLFIHLRDRIGMSDRDSVQITADATAPHGLTATTVDGLRFCLKDLPYADRYRDREQLHVAVTCSRGCGKDLWLNVASLEDLGGVLQADATNTHDFPCLQKFDEDGEPITDIMGNPLPLREQREPAQSAYQRAKAAADAVEQTADKLAQAIRAVQELEDERPNIKSACIAEMIGTPDPLKPSGVHSASSAEKVVESHARYAAHRQLQANAEVEKHRAYGAYEAAKLRGRLAVELFIAEERNR